MAINRYLNENYGSLISIEYVAAWQINAFTYSGGLISSNGIQFKNGYGWQSIYCSVDTMGHQQTLVKDVNGESWTQNVIGTIPGDEAEIEAGLLSLANQRFVLKITRPGGMVKIVGTPDQPLDLILDSDTQSTVPGTAGTGITFSASTGNRALILTD